MQAKGTATFNSFVQHVPGHCLPHPEQPEHTCWEVFETTERAALMPRAADFDGFAERECRVNSSGLVTFDRNRYSVECAAAGKAARAASLC